MKAIMVMYDSLNRHFLPGYSDSSVDLPNFRRLAERTVVFDKCYAGSLPCMPSRRELHTGSYNFLHRSWGPLEPFDFSMPEMLKKNGIHTHLSTDHYHYFEDGGATYHPRYSTYSSHRGQESDAWVGQVKQPPAVQMMGLEHMPDGFRQYREKNGRQNMANRLRLKKQEDYPQHNTFFDGIDFIERNHEQDNWFVTMETFDPHEPFNSPESIQRKFFNPDEPLPVEDWIPYSNVHETSERVENMRNKYRALLTMCDEYLGKVLDVMDKYDLWQDTLLIVNTDHGLMLNEHEWWGKSIMPVYEEISHTPLYIWDPRSGRENVRSSALVQTIDLAPTLLDYFDIEVPMTMDGKSLKQTIATDKPVREYALFGYFGDTVNITDGDYVYMRAPMDANAPLFEYTLMPTHMNARFSTVELTESTLIDGTSYGWPCKVLKIPVRNSRQAQRAFNQGNLLFDIKNDPQQNMPLENEIKEKELLEQMRILMISARAPAEQFQRIGLEYENNDRS